MSYDGGYYLNRCPLIRAGIHKHTAAEPFGRAVSDATLAALNTVQETPWRINTWILDTLGEAWLTGMSLGDIPSSADVPLPAEIPTETWEKMTREQRAAHKTARSEAHTENARLESKRISFLDKLSVAETLRSREAIWFPHTLDFRSRIYPTVMRGPHPQADDLGRALLMFAEGKPLGPGGFYWLCIRAANTYGFDKATLDDRVRWVFEHRTEICDSAADPLHGNRFWVDAEEPWSFLATCHELAQAFDDQEGFVSHLPIPMDGSCNGLQHLSAMGLDPIGAKATNLTACPERQDIYEEVASVVAGFISRDMAAGIPEAAAWAGKVNRKVVKRAVMTTPYGVTSMGIRQQIVSDGHCDHLPRGERGQMAGYLRDRIIEALDATVVSARQIMAWLQTAALRLAQAQIPLTFTTPCGNRITQSYYKIMADRVVTLLGRLVITHEEPRTGLDPQKCYLAAPPNVIHAFDASHQILTVNAAYERGIRSFAMVHDSYGTHAADTVALAAILREQFVRIYYNRDWLAEIAAEIAAYAPHVELPPLPERGKFDVSEVRDAPFFFS